MKIYKNVIRALSVMLCVVLLPIISVGCKKEAEERVVVDPIFQCGDEKLPLCFYELMLSRVRGDLAGSKQDVKSYSYWTEKYEGTDQTREEYYNSYVLNSCKNYFAAAVLFDREGMTLSKDKLLEIDEEIQFHIDLGYVGGGDVEKFNTLIKKYGVDADSLRECYIIEAKYEAIMNKLYGGGTLIGDAVKEEYYQANYYRFKQVLFPKFYYDYERDDNGDIIYFDVNEKVPLYDTKNGSVRYDENNVRLRDRFGEVIYFDENGKRLYNTEKGLPSVKLDENGEGIKYEYTDEELGKIKGEAETLSKEIAKKNFAAFESAVKGNENIIGYDNAYPDGYYLSDIESAGYTGSSAYLNEILGALKEMGVGDIRLIESDYGYHVIMKYELDEGKASDGEYAEWFTNLNAYIMNEMFLERIKDILPEISPIEENIKKARSIRNIGTNYDY